MDRHPQQLEHPVRQEPELAREVSAELRNDIARVRQTIERHKRLTVAELSQLEHQYRTTVDALWPYRQSAFSLHGLRCAAFDAGYALDDYNGDPAVFFADTPLLEKDKADFVADLVLAAPRYAHVILRAAIWSEGAKCYWWDAREIERRAA